MKRFLAILLALSLNQVCQGQNAKPSAYCTASWEQYDEAGHIGANGKPFDPNAMTCATRRYPLEARLRITDVHNGSWCIVRVTDRTPLKTKHAFDLSPKAFKCLNGLELGVCDVKVEVINAGKGSLRAKADDHGLKSVQFRQPAPLSLYNHPKAISPSRHSEQNKNN
jgi:rare lipoprotein A